MVSASTFEYIPQLAVKTQHHLIVPLKSSQNLATKEIFPFDKASFFYYPTLLMDTLSSYLI